MNRTLRQLCGQTLSLLAILIGCLQVVRADDAKPGSTPCSANDSYFVDQVWAKVGEQRCINCHHVDGDAADSAFLLVPALNDRKQTAKNAAAFAKMAKIDEGDTSRLLLKAQGELEHGGGEVIKVNSTEHRILRSFVHRVRASSSQSLKHELTRVETDPTPFFDGVTMVAPAKLLRRITLSLAARLPTAQERDAVQADGLAALDGVLDQVMREDAFYERLKEGFNDILLTSVPANGDEILSWAHFPNRLWYQSHDLSDVPEKERQRARWALADVYRQSIRREPLELIAHIVRHDHPCTEMVTADYIMVSPYSARGYGVFETVRDDFKNVDDPFEYVPVRLPALRHRKTHEQVQESPTGFYPHAGLLNTFHYVTRYPTTATNRNRLRARMYYQHFLGVDVMALAPRVTDAAAILEQHENPTMQASDCVVCHKSIDPVAGLFQDFDDKGEFGPRKEGWYEDMFGPGWEGENLPADQRWRGLQWLGERTAHDPRFATAMVEHVWYILFGRQVLKPPRDIEDPMFGPRRRAYAVQRALIDQVAGELTEADFNLKVAFKSLALSPFYRADGLKELAADACRQAELDDVGLVRLLTPEQLERKITAIFGSKWGRLTGRESKFQILYGGIDAHEVTERISEPSGVMGAIQRIMSNDVACQNVAVDFTKPAAERRLFPDVELDTVPGSDADSEQRLRATIAHLHRLVLGQQIGSEHPEVQATYQLFTQFISDARRASFEKRGSYFCDRVDDQWVEDPHYTLRAWRGVVTYLLRQREFLYE